MSRLETCIQRTFSELKTNSRSSSLRFLPRADSFLSPRILAGDRFFLTLFGSSSYGLDTMNTDLDVAIVVSTSSSFSTLETTRQRRGRVPDRIVPLTSSSLFTSRTPATLQGRPQYMASTVSTPYDLRGLAHLLSSNGFGVKRVSSSSFLLSSFFSRAR